MLLPELECSSSTSHEDNVGSYILLVFPRLCKETGLQVLQLCEQFSLQHLHCASERWLMVITVFTHFAVVGSSLAGHSAASLPSFLFCVMAATGRVPSGM